MVKNIFLSSSDTDKQLFCLSQVPPLISTMDTKTFLPPALEERGGMLIKKKKKELLHEMMKGKLTGNLQYLPLSGR